MRTAFKGPVRLCDVLVADSNIQSGELAAWLLYRLDKTHCLGPCNLAGAGIADDREALESEISYLL